MLRCDAVNILKDSIEKIIPHISEEGWEAVCALMYYSIKHLSLQKKKEILFEIIELLAEE